MSTNPFEQTDRWEVSAGGPMLAVGDHVVTIAQADDSTAGTMNPQVELKFVNDQGSIRAWETYHDQFLNRVVTLFEKSGLAIPQVGEFDPADRCRITQKKLDELVGQKIGIVVTDQDDTRPDHYGEKQRRVAGYLEPDQIDPQTAAAAAPAATAPAAGEQFGPKVPF